MLMTMVCWWLSYDDNFEMLMEEYCNIIDVGDFSEICPTSVEGTMNR